MIPELIEKPFVPCGSWFSRFRAALSTAYANWNLRKYETRSEEEFWESLEQILEKNQHG